MDTLRQYILSVTAAAILCGMVRSICSETGFRTTVNMLCGLILAVTILTPVIRIDLNGLIGEFTASYSQDALAAASVGEDTYQDSLSAIIKQESEAYILDKAAQLDASVDVEIILSEQDIPVPVSAVIRGNISPFSRQQLTQILENDLGIMKENQQWTG